MIKAATPLLGLTLVGLLGACSLDREPLLASQRRGTSGVVGGSGAFFAGSSGGGVGGIITGTSGTDAAGSGAAGTMWTGFAGNSGVLGGSGGGPATFTDAGVPIVQCDPQSSKDGMCKLTAEGVYAIKIELDVWWMDEVNPQQPLVDPGRGKLTIYFRGTISDMCEDGTSGAGELEPCGSRLPPLFVDSVCKVIQIEFPDEMWDKADMPTFHTTGNTSGFNPGDVLTIDPVTGLLGIELPTIDSPWPKPQETATFACPSGSGIACFPDQDNDGHPGVTVQINPGGEVTNAPYACGSGASWTKVAAPLGLGEGAFGLPGAKLAYIGLRMGLGGHGKIADDCVSGTGPGESSTFIPSRVFDCVIEDGSPCTAANADFVDQNVPNFHVLKEGETPPAKPAWQHPRENFSPFYKTVTLDRSTSLGPRVSVVRLGDVGQEFLCGPVREAHFPPFEK